MARTRTTKKPGSNSQRGRAMGAKRKAAKARPATRSSGKRRGAAVSGNRTKRKRAASLAAERDAR